ncbi:MAG: flagellar basal body rod protein FlgG [Sulfuricurvum sp. PC08-66]|nr:MAG: flagellar basal body rod protein FlgG [Sulfuricurvum sp. PC08-66]
MQSGYYSATGGMVVSFNKLDTVTNNLANLNTNGFKRDDLIVGDFLRLYKDKREELPLANHTHDSAKYYNRAMDRVPHVVASYTNHLHGPLQKSDNPLDFALKRDDAFFAVKTPNGIRFTRDGAFVIDKEGTLTTKEGYPVLPANYFDNGSLITFEPEHGAPHVDSHGRIYAGGNELTQLMIAQPAEMERLEKEGNSLYKPFDERRFDILKNSNAVAQGFLEKSNVNAVSEMVTMIEAHRMLGMYQKVMDTQMNDINRDAIEKIASKS